MSKYEVGDKVVMEITNKTSVMEEPVYILSDMTVVYENYIDKAAEPLSTYTEPLERKNANKQKRIEKLVDRLHNQAAEIARLLDENKRLKAENGNSLWNIEQARAEGQNEAWELARKVYLPDGFVSSELEEIFGGNNPDWIVGGHSYSEAAAKVAEWEKAKLKPQKTMMQDFMEKYPKAHMNQFGIPPICPHNLGYKKQKCSGDCMACWSRPLEQIGGEEE